MIRVMNSCEKCPGYIRAVFDLASSGSGAVGFDLSGHFMIVWDQEGLSALMKEHRAFRSVKFSAFTRSMNYYGMKKYRKSELLWTPAFMREVAGGVVFYHREFQRGRKDLLKNIRSKQRMRKGVYREMRL